ncbi:MAG: DUF305 domain-containing protein [Gemmatimonadaceae bacterium]
MTPSPSKRSTKRSSKRSATLLAAFALVIYSSPSRVGAQNASTGAMGEAAAIARARADSARYPYTAADIHFMTGMIGHHSQAIVMAGWAPTHEASSSVQLLASRIANAQHDEIRTMQQWLRDRQQPVPAGDATMHGMTMSDSSMAMPMAMQVPGSNHEPSHHERGPDPLMPGMLMPGMLTPAQMQQLDAARGREFDRLFLTFMIQHHRGALTMVKQLFATYGAAQDELTFKFASDVNVDQTTEIARMQRMLVAQMFDVSPR